MTTEIAVMNNEAVALAADSAVTISGGENDEGIVYETAQKLFSLSDHLPIGVMIYGNGSVMDIPWETIIGLCKKSINGVPSDNLDGYATTIIQTLKNLATAISATVDEKAFVRQISNSAFSFICQKIKEQFDKTKGSHQTITGQTTLKITRKCVNEVLNKISNIPLSPNLPAGFSSTINSNNVSVIEKSAKYIFDKNEISIRSPLIRDELKQIGISIFCKDTHSILPIPYSGLVVSGFGEKELFPSVITFRIKGILQGRLLYDKIDDKTYSIDFNNQNAKIIPFAQEDVINVVRFGVSEEYEKDVNYYLLKKSVEQVFGKTGRSQPNATTVLLLNRFTNFGADFLASLESVKQRSDEEWVSLISLLPKRELGQIAKTLVSLTCFYRKYKGQERSVMEPVRLAVISKLDGFAWYD